MLGVSVLVMGAFLAPAAPAQEEPADSPFPLHTIEGVGGLVLTPVAYLVNPGPDGAVCGKPAFSVQYVMIGDRDLQVVTASCTLWQRLELSYAFNRLALNDLDKDVRAAFPGVDITANEVYLHHFNARLNLIPEGAGDMSWVPAVTAGVHYKYNNDTDGLDRDLGGALTGLDYARNSGYDFTLTASKTLADLLPRPVIISAGARASRAAQFGLLGFTDEHLVTFEGSVVVLVTDKLAIGAEYRQKGEALAEADGLINDEDSWWDVHVAYLIDGKTAVYAVIGSAGAVINHRNETFGGIVLKRTF